MNSERERKISALLELYFESHDFNPTIRALLTQLVTRLVSMYDSSYSVNLTESNASIGTNWVIGPQYGSYKVEDVILNRLFLNIQDIIISEDIAMPKGYPYSFYDSIKRTVVINSKAIDDLAEGIFMSSIPKKNAASITKKAVGKDKEIKDFLYYQSILEALHTDFETKPLCIDDNANNPNNANKKYWEFIGMLKMKKFEIMQYISFPNFEQIKFYSNNSKPLTVSKKDVLYSPFFYPLLYEAEKGVLVNPKPQFEEWINKDMLRYFYNLSQANRFVSNYSVLLMCVLGKERIFNSMYLNDNTSLASLNKYFKESGNQLGIVITTINSICEEAQRTENTEDRPITVQKELQIIFGLAALFEKRLEFDFPELSMTLEEERRVKEEVNLFKKMIIQSSVKEQIDMNNKSGEKIPPEFLEELLEEEKHVDPQLKAIYDILNHITATYCKTWNR